MFAHFMSAASDSSVTLPKRGVWFATKSHGSFEASTHDWAADEKLVSGEDAEMIPAEEFVNASWLSDAQ